jgi:hypothetical protein
MVIEMLAGGGLVVAGMMLGRFMPAGRGRVPLRLGHGALQAAEEGRPVRLSGGEAEEVARAVLDAVAPILAAHVAALREEAACCVEALNGAENRRRMWRGRAERAEAAVAQVRAVHRVHRCGDGHRLERTPTPCVNDGVCSCGQPARRCPTLAVLQEEDGPGSPPALPEEEA